jgi:hypothetical protein
VIRTTYSPVAAYTSAGESRWSSSELTRGPWHPDHQHAGPPVALVASRIAREAAALGFTHVARVTANLLRPVPIAELEIAVQTDYAGRNSAHFSARLSAGNKEVARFTALAQREADLPLPGDLPGHPLPAAPMPPEQSAPAQFPFGGARPGYHELVECRVAAGNFFRGPCAIWFRLRHPMISGEAPGAIERVAAAADSGNGISAILDFTRYAFLNSDLSIHLLRPAVGEWICLEARTLLGSSSGGIAEARIYDTGGLIGRSVQSLALRLRE